MGVIFLSETSRTEALALYPRLRRAKSVVAPHGPYDCRQSTPQPVPNSLLFLGAVRPYKGVRTLVPLARMGIPVTIAGACADSTLRRDLEQAALEVGGVLTLRLSHQSEAEVEQLLHSHSLVVLPYARVHNSGSLLLALSHGRPAAAVEHHTLREVADAVPSGVRLYPAEDFVGHIMHLLNEGVPSAEAIRSELDRYCDWKGISAIHMSLYREVLRE